MFPEIFPTNLHGNYLWHSWWNVNGNIQAVLVTGCWNPASLLQMIVGECYWLTTGPLHSLQEEAILNGEAGWTYFLSALSARSWEHWREWMPRWAWTDLERALGVWYHWCAHKKHPMVGCYVCALLLLLSTQGSFLGVCRTPRACSNSVRAHVCVFSCQSSKARSRR